VKKKAVELTITSQHWIFRANDLAHKQELFDFALSCGVPMESANYLAATPYRDDEDMYLSYWEGLMSVVGTREEVNITEEQFRTMCRQYATKHA
jgi:hypothetical protein